MIAQNPVRPAALRQCGLISRNERSKITRVPWRIDKLEIEGEMPPVLQRQTAAALAAVGGGGADEVLQHFRPLRPCERLGGDGDKIGKESCRERVCQYV